jgi:aryl-alcohol dehydrogenase-like predicted oxidoreductase
MLYDATQESDRALIDALGEVAAARGVSRAQVALAWLRRNSFVAAPIVGASKASQIEDAVASLSLALSDEEVARLEAPYTPRHDFQGISDPKVLARISAQIGIKPST